MTTAYADLEINIDGRGGGYAVELRFSPPRSDIETRVVQDGPTLVQIDQRRLSDLALDPPAYGAALSEMLFKSSRVRATFDQARGYVQAHDLRLRLRLFIGPNAPELQFLRWETLRDPIDGSALATSERALFSRVAVSGDMRSLRESPQRPLRALVVIANPSDLSEYHGGRLAPIMWRKELNQARAGLGDAKIDVLLPKGVLPNGGQPTLKHIIAALSQADTRAQWPYDLLYIVAHGWLSRGQDGPQLLLEQSDGKVAAVDGAELVRQLRELPTLPRLVVLASCESGGTGTPDETAQARTALAPLLVETGVLAVLAMNGSISMETLGQFIPTFFQELRSDGRVDRAVALARRAVRERPDHWMPALFMRLRSGQIWYRPGFDDDDPSRFKRWPMLLSFIRESQCTPVLGSGINDVLLGPSRELAKQWAEAYRFPLAPHSREDLPQVAQYLTINQAPQFLSNELERHMRAELLRRASAPLSVEQREAPLADLIEYVALQRQARDPLDPIRLLAQIPFPVYITTSISGELTAALQAAGKQPDVVICPWNEEHAEKNLNDYEADPDPQRPLVYHLFGHLRKPESLVLTEDDYFKFLIGVTRNQDIIPTAVRRRLVDSALLFLGFQVDDWNFRVIFRSLMDLDGRKRRDRYAHIAAQINPEEQRFMEPDGARSYLQDYFRDSRISIFWGSIADFMQALAAQLEEQRRKDARGAS